MTSSTTQPVRGMSGRHAEGQGYGLVLFASVLMVIIGCFNLIYGIAAIANSHVFTANAHYVFGSLRTWGWITLIIAVLQGRDVWGDLAVAGAEGAVVCGRSRPGRR
jgi:sulfite exporter TauE/SafE